MLRFIKNTYFFIFLRSIKNGLEVLRLFKKKRTDFKINNFLELFIVRVLFGLAYFRNKIKSKQINIVNDVDLSIFTKKIKTNQVLEDLCVCGFSGHYLIKEEIKKSLFKDLISNLTNSQIIYKNNTDEISNNLQFLNSEQIKEYCDTKKIHMIKSEVNTLNTTNLKKVFTHDGFINLAKHYLSTNKITLISSFFISNSNLENNSAQMDNLRSKGAQKYHCDIDFRKFFKIFVYFSDVKEEGYGSHIFIPGTHKKKLKQHIITARYDSDDIEKNYSDKKIFLGESGTSFFVDTFGIHKGVPVTKGLRLMGIFEYGYGHFPWKKNYLYL